MWSSRGVGTVGPGFGGAKAAESSGPIAGTVLISGTFAPGIDARNGVPSVGAVPPVIVYAGVSTPSVRSTSRCMTGTVSVFARPCPVRGKSCVHSVQKPAGAVSGMAMTTSTRLPGASKISPAGNSEAKVPVPSVEGMLPPSRRA